MRATFKPWKLRPAAARQVSSVVWSLMIGGALLLIPCEAATGAPAAAPYRVQQQGGVWHLITPDGKRLFSRGVCCVNMGIEREKYKPEKPGYAAWRYYEDPGSWAHSTVERLRSWRFTTIGGWSDLATLRQSKRRDLAFAPVLHVGSTAGIPWFDMWDPKVIRRMEGIAREQILPIRDDPRLIGYYTDNEMGWWNAALFGMTLNQPSSSGQRQRLVRMTRQHYRGDWRRLLKDLVPVGANSFSQLERRGVLYLRPGGDGIRVIRRFLGMAAERYYQLTRQVVRKYDRRGLLMGDRYQSFYYPEVVRAAASLDVVSTNLNAYWSDGTVTRFYLDTMYKLTGRPIMIGEFYMCATENRSGNLNDASGFPVVATQEERARGFRTTLSMLLRTPFVIGADWFQYYDEPTHGREDGENYNMGLVDINNRPYEEITAAAAGLDYAGLRAAGLPRRPEASAGVPPAPREPMADMKPMLAMKRWDRERGFVRARSRSPIADLYLCWDRDAVYLGLQVTDVVEDGFYRDKRIPEVDRMLWRLRLNRTGQPIRVRLGAGRAPTVAAGSVTVKSAPADAHPRQAAVMRVPARLLGRAKLSAGDRFRLDTTLLTHARGYRMEWGGEFKLVR
jgi:hypothetical protein